MALTNTWPVRQVRALASRLSASFSVSDNGAPWASIFGGSISASGVSVTHDNAEQVSAVYACIGYISRTVATLPLHVYRKTPNNGKERAYDHPLYPILHDSPNEIMTSSEMREMMQGYLTGRGNCYAIVQRDNAGRVTAIIPVPNGRVTPIKSGGKIYYSVTADSGTLTLGPDELMHIRGRSLDGITGLSPISLARESIALAMVAEKHGASYFGNSASPSGVLETSGALKPEQVKALQDSWEERHRGAANMLRPAVLWGGVKYTPFSISNEDAQFLETRKFQVTDIARIFAVPPHKIGDLGNATFSNIEHQAIECVVDCIRPHVVRWEQRLNSVLLTPSERKEYFIEFSLDGLLRGDTKSRYESYNLGRNAGFLSANDIRDMENMNRIEGGDTYMQPLNMGPLGNFYQQQTKQGGAQQ